LSNKAFEASDPENLTSVIGPDEIHLYESKEHMATGLTASNPVKTYISVEAGHRACTVSSHHIAMKLGRKLSWILTRRDF